MHNEAKKWILTWLLFKCKGLFYKTDNKIIYPLFPSILFLIKVYSKTKIK